MDVAEVLKWDHELCGTKTFSTGLLILSCRRFELPNLEEQQKILLKIIDRPTQEYFLCRSLQAKAFDELKTACKLGWKLDTSRKIKWNVHLVAEHLALLRNNCTPREKNPRKNQTHDGS